MKLNLLTFKLLAALVLLGGVITGCAKEKTQTQSTPDWLLSHQNNQTGIAPIDKSRTASAQTALSSDPELAPFHLRVAVFNNKAEITGSVNTDQQKSKAQALVKSVPGIDQVDNKVTVVSSPTDQ